MSKAESENLKKTRQKSEKCKAVETTAAAFLAAIQKAQEAEIQPSEKVSAAVLKLIDVATKYAALPPAPPFTPLPNQQMPTVWQIAQLAALIGQIDPQERQSLALGLPHDFADASCAAVDHYHSANMLTSAALTLWRSAHDMRQIWQSQPELQQNYQAGKFLLLAPRRDQQEKRKDRVQGILAKVLAPKLSDKSRFDEKTERYWTIQNGTGGTTVDKHRFAEHWRDLAFVSWSDAAILFFRDEVPDEGQECPGKATQIQSERLAAFFGDYLKKTTPQKPGEVLDTSHFIKMWQETTDQTRDGDRPPFLQLGCFTDLWHGIIEYFGDSAAERLREKMKAVRQGGKDGSSSDT